MDPTRRAIWFVEAHLDRPLTLAEIARRCKVSSFHLTRSFASLTGKPLMRYVRRRRLTEAARRLTSGDDPIGAIAKRCGYRSHEAFSRAFRDEFHVTPGLVRRVRSIDPGLLEEALSMHAPLEPNMPAPVPHVEFGAAISLIGIRETHRCDAPEGIPNQWARLGPHLPLIMMDAKAPAFGVSLSFDDLGNFDYFCGVERPARLVPPAGLSTIDLAEREYAVFRHQGHISGIRGTYDAIWSRWVPPAGRRIATAPVLERYGPEFDSISGLGGFDILVPLQSG
jgi:AraC family transcriptional regulator